MNSFEQFCNRSSSFHGRARKGTNRIALQHIKCGTELPQAGIRLALAFIHTTRRSTLSFSLSLSCTSLHTVPRVSDSRVEKFPPKWDFWAICVDFAFRDAKSHRERVNTWFLLSEKIIAGRSELIIFHRKNNVFHHNSYVSHHKMDFLSQMRFLLYSIEASSYRVLGKK